MVKAADTNHPSDSRTTLRDRLHAGETVVGPFLSLPSPDLVEILKIAGMDFCVIDTEHGMYGEETSINLVRAADAKGLHSVIRVPEVNSPLITKALDTGADAVMVPQIGSVLDAEQAVAAARFHPEGTRGVMPHTRNAQYSSHEWPDYYAYSNKKAAVILQIEGAEGLRSLPELVEVQGVDCFFLGVMDLSQSVGVPGQPNHPLVIEKISETVALCKKNSRSVGIYTFTPESAKNWVDMGIQFIGYDTDAGSILNAFRNIRKSLYFI
tara:strand:+ start:1237 stop:2037 length:801 start_codon:yes stop_codon:yes gene_type:complete